MEYLVIYLTMALAASITSIYELVWPTIVEARSKGVDNAFTNNPYLTVFVALIVNTVVAPYWMLVLLIPSFFTAAAIGMRSTIMLSDEEFDS